MKKLSLISVLIVLNIISFLDLTKFVKENDLVEIVFMDVGQGDSILIKTDDTTGLIDAGPNSNVSYQIQNYLPQTTYKLDFAIATHLDKDHIEGYIDLLKRYEIKHFFINKDKKDTDITVELMNMLELYGTNVYSLKDLNDFTIDEITFDIRWPKTELEDESNNNSIAAVIKYKNFSMYTAGDLGKDQELKSLESCNCDVNILKVNHHGSNTSTSQEMLDILQPEIAVIPVGKDNSYGHPTEEVLNLLNSNNIKVLRTDLRGNILVKTNGNTYTIE